MSRKIKLICLCCTFLFMLGSLDTYAQQRTVTGTVKDPSGETLIGVSIIVKGEKVGTVTDVDGKYSVNVPENGKTLIASYIGMKNTEVSISGDVVNITMLEEYSNLNEVVVIGYGTAKRGEIAGSIASVGEKDLRESPVASVVEAMTGRMAGVRVTKTEGSPDAEINIRVRGGTSITQDNSPLYVVDGFIVRSISDLSPNDIESINVLKDGSLTSIYGPEGANGVIIVTTKKGTKSKMTIDFNTYVGFSKVYNLTEVLSPYDYVYYQKELDPGASITGTSFYSLYGRWEDVDIYKSKSGRNWQDELYGNTGVHQNYNLSLRGGSETLSYSLGLTHDDESYIMDNSNFKRDNINLRIMSAFNKNLDFDFTVRLSNTEIDGPSISNGKKLREAIKYAPVGGLSEMTDDMLLEQDNTLETISNLKNPLTNVNNEYKKQKKFSNSYNAAVTWKMFDWLKFRSQVSYEFINNQTDNVWIKGAGESSKMGGFPVAKRTEEKGNYWTFQNTLTFKKTFEKRHGVEVLLGQEMKHKEMKRMITQSKFFPADLGPKEVLANWNQGESMPTYTFEDEPIRDLGFLGRVNYILDGKYIFTFNARYDGKSVFAKDKRWGFFPGGGAAWRVSEESFIKDNYKWLSNLKLRASYGEAGNAKVDSYWRLLYGTLSDAKKLYYPSEKPVSGLHPGDILYNENLVWEAKVSSNLGIDFGFMNERYSGSIDFYNDKTKDLILKVPIPAHSGYAYQFQNYGKTSNKGIEISLNGYLIDKQDFKLSANFNIAFNKNKVLRFVGSDGKFATYNSSTMSSDYDYLVQEGRELGLMYGFVTEGMYSFNDFTWDGKKWVLNDVDENGNPIADISTYVTTMGNYFGPGALKLKDLNGDGEITEADRKIIGRAQPKHTGGFGLNAQYKGFDLSAFFTWSYGNDIYNANKIDNNTYSGSKRLQNISTEMSLDRRFTTIDPETGYNIYFGQYANPQRLEELNQGKTMWHPIINTTFMHSWAIEDGSYLRLNTLTLGYSLPSTLLRKVMIQNLRIYATAYNLYCWTSYSGQDPEVSIKDSNPLMPGVDYSAYPKARSFVFGANITF